MDKKELIERIEDLKTSINPSSPLLYQECIEALNEVIKMIKKG